MIPPIRKECLQCYDPPSLLFYKGNADLNAERMVAVARHPQPFRIWKESNGRPGAATGRRNARHLHCERPCYSGSMPLRIKPPSGIALPTVGVLAHGMGTIYPKEHAGLAKEMMQQGALLTEFSSRKQPDKHHFPIRNRIVAGCCDAVVVS